MSDNWAYPSNYSFGTKKYDPKSLTMFVTKKCPNNCGIDGLGSICGTRGRISPEFDDLKPEDALLLTQVGLKLGFTSTCLVGGEAIKPDVIRTIAEELRDSNREDYHLLIVSGLNFLLSEGDTYRELSEINKIHEIEIIASLDIFHGNFSKERIEKIKSNMDRGGFKMNSIRSLYITPPKNMEEIYTYLTKTFNCCDVELSQLLLVGKAYESVLNSRPDYVIKAKPSDWDMCVMKSSNELFAGIEGNDFVFYPRSCYCLNKYLELGRINKYEMINMNLDKGVSKVREIITSFESNKVVDYISLRYMSDFAEDQCPELQLWTIGKIKSCEICYQVFDYLYQNNKELKLPGKLLAGSEPYVLLG